MSQLLTTARPGSPSRRDVVAEAPGAVPVLLRDGTTALLRPVQHGEKETLLAVFDGMSEESRSLRYLTGMSRIPGSLLSMLADVDGDRHVAWVATVEGEAVGIARYVRTPGSPTTAEVAFEVVDRYHGRGLATVLLDAVTTVASARGVRRIQGTMAPENHASRRLLERVGARAGFVDGLLEAEGSLRLLAPAVVDRAEVLRVAGAASWTNALDIG